MFKVSQTSNVIKIKKPTQLEVDQGLLKWFSQQRNKNVPISGALLHSKADHLGRKMKNQNLVEGKRTMKKLLEN